MDHGTNFVIIDVIIINIVVVGIVGIVVHVLLFARCNGGAQPLTTHQ